MEPALLPFPAFDSLTREMLLESLADSAPDDGQAGTVPILGEDELAGMLERLQEAGLSLE